MNRVVGGVSRRLGRPELLAAVDETARIAQREAIGIEAVLAAVLRDGGIYVDVGTNRGQVLAEAARVAPGARLIAFEPIPDLAREVERRFPGVDCRQKAVGARAETAEFCHFRKLDGWSGLRRSPEISDSRGDPEYISVEVSTLDAELPDVPVTVLKIDVEGNELAVLEGGTTLLERARPTVIFEHVAGAAELYGYGSRSLWDVLDGLGYRVYSVVGEGPVAREHFARDPRIVNWLATPRR
ncbi:MAG TPA: FkbM family methyltransferase [Solirubrobacteraceae bacterium]|nr:FkbM family methyltransferase [Solirubrobacteraceae bacterium]